MLDLMWKKSDKLLMKVSIAVYNIKQLFIIIPNKYYRFMHPFVSRTSLFLVVQYVLFFSVSERDRFTFWCTCKRSHCSINSNVYEPIRCEKLTRQHIQNKSVGPKNTSVVQHVLVIIHTIACTYAVVSITFVLSGHWRCNRQLWPLNIQAAVECR